MKGCSEILIFAFVNSFNKVDLPVFVVPTKVICAAPCFLIERENLPPLVTFCFSTNALYFAILAFNSKHLVGDLVYQKQKENPRFLELKNMRILQELNNRYFARFMLKQVEVENQNYDAIICDAPSEFPNIISFMESCGYTSILSKPLYATRVLFVSWFSYVRTLQELSLKSKIISLAKISQCSISAILIVESS